MFWKLLNVKSPASTWPGRLWVGSGDWYAINCCQHGINLSRIYGNDLGMRNKRTNWKSYRGYNRSRHWRYTWINLKSYWTTSMNSQSRHWLRISWGDWNPILRASSKSWSQRRYAKHFRRPKFMRYIRDDSRVGGVRYIGQTRDLQIRGRFWKILRKHPDQCPSSGKR